MTNVACTMDIPLDELQHVIIGKKLGEGSFGSVYAGLLPSGRFVAVKVLELDDDSAANMEIEIHRQLVHENIIHYLHSRVDEESTPKKLYVYLEFVTGGSVVSLMKSLPNNCLPYEVARVYARHMFLGLQYLHVNNVAHRDIKGDNLLVSMDTGVAKLADFDQAKIMSSCNTLKRAVTATLSGTPFWMAPEMINDESGYNPFKADVWSAGCTVAEMILGRPPWSSTGNIMQIMNRIAISSGWPDAIPTTPERLGSQDLYNFFELCFCRDANARPTVEELLRHPFLAIEIPPLRKKSR